ncbi:MAG: hypothetical protein AAF211_25720 [Myxococcota bacterium]
MLWMLLAAGAQAAEPRAMNGRWLLDPDQSGELVPFMKAIGVPWIERQAGKNATPEHTITVAEDHSTVRIRTVGLGKEKLEAFSVNGQRQPTKARGFETASHEWSDMGVLVSQMWGTRSDGAKLAAVVERHVTDDGTLRFAIALTVDGGSPMKVERVYVKQ